MRILLDIKCNMTMQLSDEDNEKPLRLKHVGDLSYGLYGQSYNNADLDRAIAHTKLPSGSRQTVIGVRPNSITDLEWHC